MKALLQAFTQRARDRDEALYGNRYSGPYYCRTCFGSGWENILTPTPCPDCGDGETRGSGQLPSGAPVPPPAIVSYKLNEQTGQMEQIPYVDRNGMATPVWREGQRVP